MKKIQTILISASAIASLLISTPALASHHDENDDNGHEFNQVTSNINQNQFNSGNFEEHASEHAREAAKDAAEATREAAKSAAEAIRESAKDIREAAKESEHESIEHGIQVTTSDTTTIDTSTQNASTSQFTNDNHDDEDHQATVATDTSWTPGNSFGDLALQLSEIRRSLMAAIQNIIDTLFSNTFVITPSPTSTTSTP